MGDEIANREGRSERDRRRRTLAERAPGRTGPVSHEGGRLPTEAVSGDSSLERRSFLRLSGAAVGSLFLEQCSRGPTEEMIPYLVPPEDLVPGEPIYYTSVCGGCTAGCGVLAKCLDGRPVKLEGNPDHPASRGALCALGQASLWELYDSGRALPPRQAGREVPWETLDFSCLKALEEVRRRGLGVTLLTGTINRPSLLNQLQRFAERWEAAWYSYDPISVSAVAAAHERTHGLRAVPDYRIDRADVLVGVGADFLGHWMAPVEFAQGYRDGRQLETSRLRLSRHYQFEPYLTLTGARADFRYLSAPGEEPYLLAALVRRVAALLGRPLSLPPLADPRLSLEVLDDVADHLVASAGRSLVLCGAQNPAAQVLTNLLNEILSNYGRTVEIAYPSFRKTGWEADLETLRKELAAGDVGAVIMVRCDPVFELFWGKELASHLDGLPVSVLVADQPTETADHVRFFCPEPHYLERWEDSQPTARVTAPAQPAVKRLGSTRPALETFERWLGGQRDDLTIVRDYWREKVYPRQVGVASFEQFWTESLAKGAANIRPERVSVSAFRMEALESLGDLMVPERSALEGESILVLHPSNTIAEGRHSHNPWLQELPDPITDSSWGPVLRIPKSPFQATLTAQESSFGVQLETQEREFRLTALEIPGQHSAVVAAPLGYGRPDTDRLQHLVGPIDRGRVGGSIIGVNLFTLVTCEGGFFQYHRPVRWTHTEAVKPSAALPGSKFPSDREKERPLEVFVRRMTLAELLSQRSSEAVLEEAPNLWPEDHGPSGRHWGMAIDLGACTGCGACVVACQAENNIPCVGPEESSRGRLLHWIRLHRYHLEDFGDREDWIFQPMLCQHCDRAPCEVVCPVLATVHSSEGLNEQIYNRCIGTRYCANNCPYKVRAFNWFDYRDTYAANGEKPGLNPEVTVRTRGVMEKCTFCVQRIQRAKIEEKLTGEPLAVQTACQQTCPSRAIVFGDLNDPEDPLAGYVQNPRRYRVLAELGTRPSVFYLALVRNQETRRKSDG